jgi:hypothetical protein
MATVTPTKNTAMKLQPGEYEATVTAVEDAGLSDGKFGDPTQRWLFKLKIDACVDCFSEDDPSVCDGKIGEEHFQWCNESSAPKSTMYKLVKACGLDPDEFDTDDCVGKRLKFTYDEDVIGGKTVTVITTARPIRGKRTAQADTNEPPF